MSHREADEAFKALDGALRKAMNMLCDQGSGEDSFLSRAREMALSAVSAVIAGSDNAEGRSRSRGMLYGEVRQLDAASLILRSGKEMDGSTESKLRQESDPESGSEDKEDLHTRPQKSKPGISCDENSRLLEDVEYDKLESNDAGIENAVGVAC